MISTNFFRSLSKLSRNDFIKLLRLTDGSQPHEISLPWLQALATLCATPADDTAYANALSR